MEKPILTHYYGDHVRRLFLSASFIMLAELPFVHEQIPEPIVFSIISIVILAVAAGATNPIQRWSAIMNVIISLVEVIIFESYAVFAFNHYSGGSALFWMSQLLGIIFLVALYFSVKTLRGELLEQ